MQALLPPPFPTATPLRCYVSNMAVLPGFRRRGAATALLQSCARLGAPAQPLLACGLHTIATWLLYIYLLATACCWVWQFVGGSDCTPAVLLFLGGLRRMTALPVSMLCLLRARLFELVTCRPVDATLGGVQRHCGARTRCGCTSTQTTTPRCACTAAGFALHLEDGGWFGLPRRRLLRRQLRPRGPVAAECRPSPRSEGQSSGDIGPAPDGQTCWKQAWPPGNWSVRTG